jgi:hypothetical protein
MNPRATSRPKAELPRLQKAIVVSEASGDALARHLAELDLPKRALSLPVAPTPPTSLPSFAELWGSESEIRAAVARWPFPSRAWLVEEFVPVAYERTWRSGEASPGLRMVSALHRRADLSREAFEAHWRGPHALVAKSYTVPVWNYVQNVVRVALGHDSDVDGFVGMHFRTAEDLEARWRDHPREAARGAEDAAKFMAVDRSIGITTIETIWDEVVGSRA